MGRYVIATDMGGTFVDAVVWDLERKSFHIGKSPTTPLNPPEGILKAVVATAERAQISRGSLFSDAELFVNGTTVTTNAMIERKGARTGLLITAGFEDTLEIGNVVSRTIGLEESDLLDYRHAERPAPFAEQTLVRSVTERIDRNGDVVVKLDEEQAIAAIDELVAAGAEALAICFLWSFRNPAHELRLKELVEKRHPNLYVVSSNELVPVMREYERANTTAINAFLGRVFERYATGLRSHLRDAGYVDEPLVMQSVGGLAPAREIQRRPIATLFSGPVGGVIAGASLAQMLGETNLITADMGGTSFDVGLVLNGGPVTVGETVIERQIVAAPTVEIVTIGAGGGSAARTDDFGILHVGPESMGAMPGPACYNRGGTTPTVTDADVILGYIDPDHFLGGKMEISRDLAEEAMRPLANQLDMPIIEAAAAVYKIVNARMADLIRRATVERGHDPRDFVMAAFGGCGPTHSTGYGPEVGVRQIAVPPSASTFSAFGIGRSDLRHSWVKSFSAPLRGEAGGIVTATLDDINAICAELMGQAREQLERDGVDENEARFGFSADIRYRRQVHELLVPFRGVAPFEEEGILQMAEDFAAGYERRYGSGASSPNTPIEWVNLRLDTFGSTRSWVNDSMGPSGTQAGDALIEHKKIYDTTTNALREAPVYRAEAMAPGSQVEGLALIVSYGSTIPLHVGQTLKVDRYGNMLITYKEADA